MDASETSGNGPAQPLDGGHAPPPPPPPPPPPAVGPAGGTPSHRSPTATTASNAAGRSWLLAAVLLMVGVGIAAAIGVVLNGGLGFLTDALDGGKSNPSIASCSLRGTDEVIVRGEITNPTDTPGELSLRVVLLEDERKVEATSSASSGYLEPGERGPFDGVVEITAGDALSIEECEVTFTNPFTSESDYVRAPFSP